MREIELSLDDGLECCDECFASETEDITSDIGTELRKMFQCDCGFVICQECKDTHKCYE